MDRLGIGGYPRRKCLFRLPVVFWGTGVPDVKAPSLVDRALPTGSRPIETLKPGNTGFFVGSVDLLAVFLAVYWKNEFLNPSQIKACRGLFDCLFRFFIVHCPGNTMTSISDFLTKVMSGVDVEFSDTMAVIAEHYDYRPTEFRNGIGEQCLINAAGSNEGSCKIFAFAKLHSLTEAQTLSLFGTYYRQDVLQRPDAIDHQNIRTFISDGWQGIVYAGQALTAK